MLYFTFLQFEQYIGVKIAMAPIDKCSAEQCEEGDCSNTLVTTPQPILINTNATSLIGVTAHIVAECNGPTLNNNTAGEYRPENCFDKDTCHHGVVATYSRECSSSSTQTSCIWIVRIIVIMQLGLSLLVL